ncbi:MAG: TrmO family methyltransferase domain-containing protein [Bacteroidales bacterium]
MIHLEPIGRVVNAFDQQTTPEEIKSGLSEIRLNSSFAEGLYEIEKCEFLDIVFMLDRAERTDLTATLRNGEKRGIFATRSPFRPNHIGITTVKFVRKSGNSIFVTGLDALNHSPVIDIKCCDTSMFEQETMKMHAAVLKTDPRIDVDADIRGGKKDDLLLKAGMLHGHICPGLAQGVYAGYCVMKELYSRGMQSRDYVLTVYMENCLVDGIMFVTGATPGGRRFHLIPEGRMYFTFLDENGKGWEVSFRDEGRDYINEHIDADLPVEERGLRTMMLDPAFLFEIKEVQ